MTKRDDATPDAPDVLPLENKIIDVGDELDDTEARVDEQDTAAFIDFLTNSPTALAINARYGALDMDAPDIPPGPQCSCLACRSRREYLDDMLRSFVQRTQLYPMQDGSLQVAMPTYDAPAQVTLTPEREDGVERTTDTIARHVRAWMPPEQLARAIESVKRRREETLTLAKAIVHHHALADAGCSSCDSERCDDGESGWTRTCNGSGRCGPDPLHQLGDYSGWSLPVAQRIVAEAQAEIRRDLSLGHNGRVAQEESDKAADAANAVPLRGLQRDASGKYVPAQRVTVEQMCAEMSAHDPLWTPLLPLTFPVGPPAH